MMRLFALCLVVSSLAAFAQEDAGVAEPAPPAATTPPPAAPAPAPTALGVLETLFQFARPYATIKPTVIASSGAVESYSQPNATAITAAANPVISTLADQPRLSFQVGQSRAGLWFNEKGQVRGQLEFDFVDFSKASPTVASLPRVRIAKLEWAPSEKFSLQAGQDWDLHAPVNPHGGNLVGARFLSGNAAFMRQQIKALGRVGDFELAAAVGMQGVNATAKDAAFELSMVPTVAVRAAWLVGKGRVGLSGIATSLRLGLGTTNERRAFSGGGSLFADVTFGRTTFRGELNAGQNLANIGLLTLAYGNTAKDIAEWGGFLSARHGFTDMHFIYANAGLMRVINRDAVVPSYAYPTVPMDGSAPAMSTAALAGTGPGILHNGGATLGYELRINKNLAFMLEGFFLWTEHKLNAFDLERVSSIRQAFGGELCGYVSF
ncbi:MAG: hypothetical protein ACOZQL_08655 [Myxococcota bacterium]